ncbi:MAG TPA: S8 family serine peptidase [Pseudonocardiaceae bacterium]|nr:S8 family serine peptidase [Pseudonocardiaceae bacterium]
MPLLRRARAVTTCTALLAAGCLVLTPLAHADPGHGTSAGCVQGGPTLRYLVVFAEGTGAQDADAQISAACGATTIYYPQIAVAVATSADPSFGTRMGPNRAYSAEAEGYDDNGDVPTDQRKPDELPGGLSGTQAIGNTTDPASVPTANQSAAQWDMDMIHADAAHRVDQGSSNVVVGVLDSGIDAAHPNLTGELDASASAGCVTGAPDTTPAAWQPTDSAHGTHVAGTIAAADDGKGISGVAPGVKVASVKVVDDDGYIYPEAAVCGFMWAAEQGMAITNSSYYIDPWVFTCRNAPGQSVVYEAVRRAVAYATSRGVLNVAAAGNQAVDLTNPGEDASSPDNVSSDDRQQRALSESCVELPAGLPGVVTVSAVGAEGLKASYSSYGLGAIDVTAPGGDTLQPSGTDGPPCVLSTVPDGYARSCGTSMATPHVSGVVALLASTHPGAGPKKLTQLLESQAQPVSCPADYDLNGSGVQNAYCTGDTSYNSFYGYGMVDALAAVTQGVPEPSSAQAAPASVPRVPVAGLSPVSSDPVGGPTLGGQVNPTTTIIPIDSITPTDLINPSSSNGVPTSGSTTVDPSGQDTNSAPTTGPTTPPLTSETDGGVQGLTVIGP